MSTDELREELQKGLGYRILRFNNGGTSKYLDNNLAEKSIRPAVLGRKKYLFAGSHSLSRVSKREGCTPTMKYSILGSCKLNDIEPRGWLTDTLSKIQDTKMSDLGNLLPGKSI